MATIEDELAGIDETRTYSQAEKQVLTENLLALTSKIHSGRLAENPVTVELICDLHRELFRGVRDHGGQCRRKGFGQEYLTFGPNRSSHRDRVATELSGLLTEAERCLRSFDGNTDDPNYELSALRVGLHLHAKLIKIHPFEDGNGRTGRLLLDLILLKLGVAPAPIEVPKEEYLEAMNRFYADGGIEPLVSLYLRCYVISGDD